MSDGKDKGTGQEPQAEYLLWQLRGSIVKGREEAGLSQKQVAEELDWHHSKVSRIENGGVTVTPADVRALFSVFGASPEEIKAQADLALEARKAWSWNDYSDVLSSEYRNYIAKEQSSKQALKYETGLVPGLLQTLDYSKALFSEMGTDEKRAARLSEVRQLRQRVLDIDDGLEMVVVIGELVLVRQVGGRDIMRDQIEHLRELSTHRRIGLFLIPFSAGAHDGMGTPYTVLKFREEEIPHALYVEDGLKQTTSVEDSTLVAEHIDLFGRLQEIAERTGSFDDHATRILEQHYQ